MKAQVLEIVDTFLQKQSTDGGWVVRYGIIDGELSRIEAPNDSAYIAGNALLTAYCDNQT